MNKNQWEEIKEFYNDLIEKYHWKQQPMLELINKLEEKKFFNKYYLSTSHEALGLCTVDNYKERLEKPMVYILYQSTLNTFTILFQEGQGNTILEDNCGKEINTDYLNRIENWLLNGKI